MQSLAEFVYSELRFVGKSPRILFQLIMGHGRDTVLSWSRSVPCSWTILLNSLSTLYQTSMSLQRLSAVVWVTKYSLEIEQNNNNLLNSKTSESFAGNKSLQTNFLCRHCNIAGKCWLFVMFDDDDPDCNDRLSDGETQTLRF